MGDRKQRLRDAAILERAASILPRYRLLPEDATPRVRLEVDADRWQIGPAYSIQANPAHLRWIAENLRAMPSRTDRQDWSVLLAARAFEMLIARRLGGPVSPRDVGDLVQAAWPDRFRKHHRPADGVDPADAARKLLARARAAVDDEEAARVIDDGCRTRPPTVPEIVPATTSGQAKTTSRQPTTKRKTPR